MELERPINNIVGTVTEIKTIDSTKFAQKFAIEFEGNTIDVIIWYESDVLDLSVGDTLLLTSVSENKYNGQKYLSFNSNSTAYFADEHDINTVIEETESPVEGKNTIAQPIRIS